MDHSSQYHWRKYSIPDDRVRPGGLVRKDQRFIYNLYIINRAHPPHAGSSPQFLIVFSIIQHVPADLEPLCKMWTVVLLHIKGGGTTGDDLHTIHLINP